MTIFHRMCVIRLGWALCALAVLTLSCASQRAAYKVEQQFLAPRYSGMSLSGHSILVLPIITRNGLDTAALRIQTEDRGPVSRIRPDLTIVFDSVFDRDYVDTYGHAAWKSLLESLSNKDVLALQNNDSLWDFFEQDFLLVMRLMNSARIKSFEGRFGQRVQMEGELWKRDTAAAQVVWRGEVVGVSTDKTVADRVFVRDAIREMIRSLPSQKGPAEKDETW
jgi:hypothetical protein